MFEIEMTAPGKIRMAGRLDASQAERAAALLDTVDGSADVDMGELSYISSMGLGVLLKAHKRLREAGGAGLRLVSVSRHIHDIFRYSGFLHIFEVEVADG